MGDQGGESFLTRWARLKRQSGEAPRSSPAPEPRDPRDEVESTAPSREQSTTAPDPAAESSAPSEADFADVDFDALDQTSDYTRFMQPGVPEAIRHKALRKLWASDPALSMPDELNDYMGDYTDAAVAATGRLLTTAYKVGRGFLDDDEVAAWERLGRPEPAPGSVADASAETPPEQPSGGEPASRSLATRPEEPEGSPVAPEERGSTPAEPAAPDAPARRGQG
jgi:hypothetical protein